MKDILSKYLREFMKFLIFLAAVIILLILQVSIGKYMIE